MQFYADVIRDQGWICAYTMKRVEANTSHVEHIKPETLCREDKSGSDLDYRNMVACFPRDGMKCNYRYGAQARDDWWENDGGEFVKPLDNDCEKRFRFDLEGNIIAANNNAAAAKTIERLGLDHSTLTEDRMRVIGEIVYGETGDNPLSSAQAAWRLKTICDKNGEGCFYEFCVAIRDALEQHILNLKRLANKRKYARKKKP